MEQVKAFVIGTSDNMKEVNDWLKENYAQIEIIDRKLSEGSLYIFYIPAH